MSIFASDKYNINHFNLYSLMNTEELSNRLTQILTGITSGEPNPNIIQGFVQNFIEDFNIYLEREYCEY